jgi:hypothetical protein
VLIPDQFVMLSGCLFTSALHTDNLVSPDWDGPIPISEVVKWFTELEAFANQENDHLIARLRQVRNALAAQLANDNGSNTAERSRTPKPMEPDVSVSTDTQLCGLICKFEEVAPERAESKPWQIISLPVRLDLSGAASVKC